VTNRVSIFGFDFHFIVKQREINKCTKSVCDGLELSKCRTYYKIYLKNMRIPHDFFFFRKLAETKTSCHMFELAL